MAGADSFKKWQPCSSQLQFNLNSTTGEIAMLKISRRTGWCTPVRPVYSKSKNKDSHILLGQYSEPLFWWIEPRT